MSLNGKFAVITGGGTGIGLATARLLGKEGARVCILGRREDVLDEAMETMREQGVEVMQFKLDISNASLTKQLFEVLRSKTGHIDILVNNAGIYRGANVAELDERDWDDTFDINVKGVYLVTRSLLPLMETHGAAVVNIASTLAFQVVPGASAYSASKAAVVSLTKSMALELAGNGIRVNCICPGIVDTPIQDPVLGMGEMRRKKLEEIGRTFPLGRVGRSEDIAEAVRYLCSESASWITGSVLTVDGGISLLAV
jgi:NAD(P)-dependent dehydrogenase (short-subunit alcohol dehydrogenase family)